MRITADTLNQLLAGTYDDHIEQYVIIDCRFEYEYQGGHVEGAINLGTEKSVEEFLLHAGEGGNHLFESQDELPYPTKSGEPDHTGNTKKTILVFHCEFSAKRAPTLAKYLRSRDRALNHAAYPSVHFPELYILQGGYAE
ncbi:Rhodanese-like protein, partial [Cystobasidium minutum MCA 4210]|uniref:Rhodanese-like protein n=1 Tax=Cystobasidium minutum MCA 4210 TaxID=1397322 RepID=UPI0034CD0335|eukprot:jgi/Rhomi1/145697/e_gw1.5.744.1